MLEAARTMRNAISAVSRHCDTVGIPIDEALDPNRTGLIGPECTELFTTLGNLEAKRTTTNPDVAGLLVRLLRRAGVSAGDTIAVAASGSFPALLIATVSAAETMGVHPATILSLGASSYGATRPEFNLLNVHRLLLSEGILRTPLVAVSLGGEGDVGAEFEPGFRARLVESIRETGIPFLYEPDLRENVARRIKLHGERVGAFVNIGGSDANLGSSPLVLRLRPGLNTDVELPPPSQRGVLFEWAARDVPVIHLLNVRGLALRHGIPWDPIPLPGAGATPLRDGARARGAGFWLLTAAYFGALGLIGFWGMGSRPGDAALR
jgi:poly-gamma-glutamate system protein